MSTVNNKLTNLADEIRVLAGTTEPLGLTEMATNVNDANDEVADQTDLIAQLASALQGKSVPGGGEDVTAETETYTNLLTDLEAAVDALPDARSGVDTCTVVLDASSTTHRALYFSYTTVDSDGNVVGIAAGPNSDADVTINNVVCGTIVTVYWNKHNIGQSYTNATAVISTSDYHFCAYLITAPAGGTVTLKSTNASGAGSN
jgi:hypothetical protein